MIIPSPEDLKNLQETFSVFSSIFSDLPLGDKRIKKARNSLDFIESLTEAYSEEVLSQ